jgi:hypothetical protein
MTSVDSSLAGAPSVAGRLIVWRWLIRAGPAATWALTVQYSLADKSIERATAAVYNVAPSMTCRTVISRNTFGAFSQCDPGASLSWQRGAVRRHRERTSKGS